MGASYLVMVVLVSRLRLVPEVGNALSVALISLVNFALADRLIFQVSPEVS